MNKIVFKDYKNIKQVIDLLFEDDNLLVINKPAHLPVIPDRFGTYNYNLRDIVKKYLYKTDAHADIWIVHRIDADTTGLVLLCKNEMYHKQLNDLFEGREVNKTYWAIVQGHLPQTKGVIDKPILKTARKMIIDGRGKPSRTDYQVLEEFENYSLVQLKPLTGRTHQLRIHLKSLNCPLAVDPVYSKNDAFYLNQIKKNYLNKKQQEPKALCARLTLHAQKIEFTDPITHRNVKFEAPLAKDFMAVLKSLRKYNPQHSFADASSGQRLLHEITE